MSLELMLQPGYVDPEWNKIIEKNGPVQGLDAFGDVMDLRKLLAEKKKGLTTANAGTNENEVTEKDHEVPTRDGSSIVVRSYHSKHTSDNAPVLVMLHGGGWCLGDLDNEALLCRKWCEDFGGVSFNVDYRLAPEHKFPTAVHDAYDAVLWVKGNAASLAGNIKAGFVVGGVSAGANLTASVALLYRDDKNEPPLTGLYLSIPSLLSPGVVPEKYQKDFRSRDENKDAPILGQGALDMFRKHYQPDEKSPLMTPFIWPSGHAGLPPTYFQIAGSDPLRDDGLLYDRLLKEQGVSTKVDMYPGLPHGFWSWFPDAEFSKKQFQDSLKGFRWLLGRSTSS